MAGGFCVLFASCAPSPDRPDRGTIGDTDAGDTDDLGGIIPYVHNSSYWQYRGQPIFLRGSGTTNSIIDGRYAWWYYRDHHDFVNWDDSLDYSESLRGFMNGFDEEIRLLTEAGGNYIRFTLADFSAKTVGADRAIYPFSATRRDSDGVAVAFDLDSWNPDFWDRLDYVFEVCHANGVIIQLELWDGWALRDGARSSIADPDSMLWGNLPWSPWRNDKYHGSTGLSDRFTGKREDNPFKRMFVDDNKNVVQRYAELFVKEVLDHAAPYDNIIFQVENESPNSISDWSIPWADFVHDDANNPYDGLIYITDMRDQYQLFGIDTSTKPMVTSVDQQAILNDPVRFNYFDASQHSRFRRFDDFYDHIYTFIADHVRNGVNQRPVNIVKIYSTWTEIPGWNNRNSMHYGIHRFWANIFAGVASVRYHRAWKNADYVSLAESRKDLLALVWILDTNAVEFWDMVPVHYSEAFLRRTMSGSAYAMHNPDTDQYLVYFENMESSVTLRVTNGSYTVFWYNRDTSEAAPSSSRSVIDGTLVLRKSDVRWSASDRCLLVITKS